MSSAPTNPSKIHGHKEAAAGAVKETVGDMTGSVRIETEGAARKEAGHAEVKAAQVKGQVGGAVDSTTGNIKKNVGDMTGNESTAAEGAATQLKGDAKQATNNP
ncbi:putative cruciform DNA binding protein [Geranomyces variabilis]|nr:putative cruciform DNA binding protein [Geranomyces variabilis]KAJ3143539.1 hypothetical protein HDU90_000302 [Geranomyces variabilis]